MSPTISIESFMESIKAARPWTDAGGITSAMGFPNRVTRIGFFVLETSASSAKHLALNSEIAIFVHGILYDHYLDHGQINGQVLALSNVAFFTSRSRSLRFFTGKLFTAAFASATYTSRASGTFFSSSRCFLTVATSPRTSGPLKAEAASCLR